MHQVYYNPKLVAVQDRENKPFPIAETSQPTPFTVLTLLMAVLLLPAHCLTHTKPNEQINIMCPITEITKLGYKELLEARDYI